MRERIALTGKQVGPPLRDELLEAATIGEAVGLSTCNRAELYVAGRGPRAPRRSAGGALARYAGSTATSSTRMTYELSGNEVVRHLYRVTAGLDSMVVGEYEIQGQVKRTLESALAEGRPAR